MTQASRSGIRRHSQNEPKLRSPNVTEPYVKTIRVLDGTIYERRTNCHLNVEQKYGGHSEGHVGFKIWHMLSLAK